MANFQLEGETEDKQNTGKFVNGLLSGFGTALSGFGSVQSLLGKSEQLQFQAGLADANASLLQTNAALVKSQAGVQQVNIRRAGRETVGRGRGAIAASGVRLGGGVSQAFEGEVEQATGRRSIAAKREAEFAQLNIDFKSRSLQQEARFARKGAGALRRQAGLSALGSIISQFGGATNA